MVNRFENGQSTQTNQSIPRILIVTGHGDSMKQTQLWPKPDSQCTLHDFPLEVSGAVGFWTAQGPTVCGGRGGGNKCFFYSKEHQWMPWTNLGTARNRATALQINPNHALIGGKDENGNYLKTTELMSSSGSEEGIKFPVTIYAHCSFKINGTKSFGIVSGGLDEDRYSLDSTEMIELDQESPTWTEGPKLPRKLETLTLVETSQGTYAMGGWDVDRNERNEVFQLDCPGDQISSCQWKEVGNLEFARYDHVSIPIPESYDICN